MERTLIQIHVHSLNPMSLNLKLLYPPERLIQSIMMYQKMLTFLLLDQPSREANTTATLISKIDELGTKFPLLGTKFPLNQQTPRPALVIGTHKP